MTLPAGTVFKIVRGDLARVEEELKTAKEALIEAKRVADASSVESKDVAKLRETVERQERELAVVNVEATENFQKTITKPLQAAKAEITRLATQYSVAEPALRAALAEADPGKRNQTLSELSSEFNRLDTIAFDRAVTRVMELEQARTATLATASEQLTEAQAERQRAAAEAEKTFKVQWEKARSTALSTLTEDKTALGVLFNKTGDEKFDAQVVAMIEEVQSLDITKIPNESLAAELFKGRALPLAVQLVASQQDQITALTEEVAKLRGGTPPVGDGTPPGVVPGTPAAPTTFAEAAKQMFASGTVLPR